MLLDRILFCRFIDSKLQHVLLLLQRAAREEWAVAPPDKNRILRMVFSSLNRGRQLIWPASKVIYAHDAGKPIHRIFRLAVEFVRKQQDDFSLEAWLSALMEFQHDCSAPSSTCFEEESAELRQSHRADSLQTAEILHSRLFLEIAVLSELLDCVVESEANTAVIVAAQKLEKLTEDHYDAVVRKLLPFERQLDDDLAGIYPFCDTATKNAYRTAVVSLAAKTQRDEIVVAVQALALCRSQDQVPIERSSSIRGSVPCIGDDRAAHIGHFLIGNGVVDLLSALGHTPKRGVGIGGTLSITHYIVIGGLISASLLIATGGVSYLGWMPLPILLSTLLLSYDSANSILQETLQFVLPQRHCPSLMPQGIDRQGCRVAVAVPTLMISIEQLDEVLACLEKNFCTMHDSSATMIVLADFEDSQNEKPSEHELCLRDHLINRVIELNQRYGQDGRAPFLVIDRPRRFSLIEQAWMGWERKLGKIEALFDLILGKANELRLWHGAADALNGIRYVVVLDDDNVLAPGAVDAFVGAMAHPLNRPLVGGNGVFDGHAIGVPYIRQRSTSGRWPELNWRLSDFDLFGQLPYPGKGIYDVEAYVAATQDRIPEGCVLSHDTAEGFWARPALVNQASVLEDYPSSYLKLTERQQRWMRGNWQNLLLMASNRFRNPPAIAWLFLGRQNRATLLPIAKIIALVGSMVLQKGELPAFCSMLFISILPSFVPRQAFQMLLNSGRSARERLREVVLFHAVQFVIAPHRALIAIDAIVRSTWRMVNRKRLLQWQSAASLEQGNAHLNANAIYLLFVPLLAGLFVGYLAISLHRYGFSLWVTLFWVIAPMYLFRIKRDAGFVTQPRVAQAK